MNSKANAEKNDKPAFDRSAAVTRSLLGYGVLAGVVYLVTGVTQALLRDGFDLSRHSLSLLANGSWGWVQTANFVISGLMVLAAAYGFSRALAPERRMALLVGIYGLSLIAAGAFAADPMDGFPPGTPSGVPDEISVSGLIHLAAGGIGFLSLALAFVFFGAWCANRLDNSLALASRFVAGALFVTFVAGAVLATSTVGTALIWIAVVLGWTWLAFISIVVYRTVPHPDATYAD